ncbi:MAG: NUDIX hydrolase [Patescibacteria group bacterium]
MDKSILLQVGVKVFLKERFGNYLLLKRSPVRYPNIKNLWDIPGGRIIPGTTISENVKREVFEETGLPIDGELKLVGVQDIIRLPEKHIVRLTFSATTSGAPVLNEEHLEFKWVTLKEMKELRELDEFTREILEKKYIE